MNLTNITIRIAPRHKESRNKYNNNLRNKLDTTPPNAYGTKFINLKQV